jgi:hypothetical protein
MRPAGQVAAYSCQQASRPAGQQASRPAGQQASRTAGRQDGRTAGRQDVGTEAGIDRSITGPRGRESATLQSGLRW